VAPWRRKESSFLRPTLSVRSFFPSPRQIRHLPRWRGSRTHAFAIVVVVVCTVVLVVVLLDVVEVLVVLVVVVVGVETENVFESKADGLLGSHEKPTLCGVREALSVIWEGE
jgi:hypothetical protein